MNLRLYEDGAVAYEDQIACMKGENGDCTLVDMGTEIRLDQTGAEGILALYWRPVSLEVDEQREYTLAVEVVTNAGNYSGEVLLTSTTKNEGTCEGKCVELSGVVNL